MTLLPSSQSKRIRLLRMTIVSKCLTQPPLVRHEIPVMDGLRPTNVSELRHIIMKGPSKTCVLEPSPTDLLKDFLDSHLPTLVQIVFASLMTGNFPKDLMIAVVIPLLKNSSLDKNSLRNYHPVSNLAYIGKLIEKVVMNRLTDHMHRHALGVEFQSTYKAGHSTETARLKIHDDVWRALD